MIISMIAAVARNGVIGKTNDLPWHLPDDMKYFMQITQSHHVVMGRKNYESLPEKFKPLPNRTNIVLTHQLNFVAANCQVLHHMEDAICLAKKNNETELFIIGGAEIYQAAFPQAHQLYLTEIDAAVEGDTFFPVFDKKHWKELLRQPHAADSRHAFAFDFVVYKHETHALLHQ